MTFSVKASLDDYVATITKVWEHDRLASVGASEIGQCGRRTFYSKASTPPDEGYIDDWGPRFRGNLYEDLLAVPALRMLNSGYEAHWTGDQQRTIASGFLSATPDGLVTGPDEECFLVEIKTLDPRVDIRKARDSHAYQVQVQMGLVREFTNYQPTHAVVAYINASFPSDVTEFRVEYDQRIYDAAVARAKEIMGASDPLDLKPEGAISGGRECDNCPFKRRCRGDAAAAHPKDKGELPEDVAEDMIELLHDYDLRLAAAEAHTVKCNEIKHELKELLRANNVRWTEVGGWKVNWQSRKGKLSLDQKAMERDGIDLSKYQVEGDPFDVLVIK
jgi:hypothetical protein